jgi:prepilin-type processing-associated H-X9-DG protein
VNGKEDWTANNTDNTNLIKLANALIGPYCNHQTKIYKCPGDLWPCQENGQALPRVRSISMNGFIEGDAYLADKAARGIPLNASVWYYQAPNIMRAYVKASDITLPGPSDLLVFIDEQADSIDDGWFITDVESPNGWEDLPAAYHSQACGMGFADGHATTHKWLDGSTVQPVLQVQRNGPNNFPAPNPPNTHDIQWMLQHTSAPL